LHGYQAFGFQRTVGERNRSGVHARFACDFTNARKSVAAMQMADMKRTHDAITQPIRQLQPGCHSLLLRRAAGPQGVLNCCNIIHQIGMANAEVARRGNVPTAQGGLYEHRA
jgi:hypothetical protein